MIRSHPSRSESLLSRAREVLPGGVSSPVRSFAAVGGSPRVIVRAEGCRLFDVEGREFIDYVGAWGPAILGHAHPVVVEAIARAARDGASFGLCSSGDVELAELIIERAPGVERVRFCNSGTEATMTAVRLARAATNRPLIVKFDGCYHGHADGLLVRAGSGVATFAVPDSAGVPRDVAVQTLVLPFNDLAAVEQAFSLHGQRIAAILVEPVAGNMGLVPAGAGFLAGLRDAAARHGALLIFDEVMTGFRVARGGAAQLFGITPDLCAFGKIIGGGLPVGAVGGSAALMDRLAPAGPVYSAGTFSGNPVVMAAGAATLNLLDQAAYVRLESAAARLHAGLAASLSGVVHEAAGAVIQRIGSMLSVFFGGERNSVRSMDDARRCDQRRFAAIFHAMLDRGVHLPPSAFESWFVSLAHDVASIDATIAAFRSSLEATSAPIDRAEFSPLPKAITSSRLAQS